MRLNPDAWKIIGLLDGKRTLEEIWSSACMTQGDHTPTQDEVLQLLTQLHQANVLLTGHPPDLDEMDVRRRKMAWMKIKQYLVNPLSIKIPFVDPDRFLRFVVRCLPSGILPFFLVAWLVFVGFGVATAVVHWSELSDDITARVFTPENMLLMALAFPLLKAIHELGHGIAIKLLGGSCHEMGLMFLVLVPVPYVDVSQATAFPSKFHRMLVGLAGMMIELVAATMALLLWIQASPGVGKAFLHQVAILAGFTTVVFNANPLLRFDGYYVLADWLEIPNLGQKSNQYVGRLINRYMFGVKDHLPLMTFAPRERPWLLSYALGSVCYRMIVAVAIVLFVGQQFFFVGVLLAIWSAWGTLVAPIAKHLRYLADSRVLDGNRFRAISVSTAVCSAILASILYIPVGAWTNAEGVVWMPDSSRVRAAHGCFATELLVKPGEIVREGQALMHCAEAELASQVAQARERYSELTARLAHAQATDRVQTQLVHAEVVLAQKRLADVQMRHSELTIRSPRDGRFTIASPGDFAGRYFERGEVLAYVLDPARFTLLTVVGQGDVDQVRKETKTVEMRMADQPGTLVAARIEREVPAATTQLPSMALALQGGGRIGLAPGSAAQDPQSLAALFQFELLLLDTQSPSTVGQRVHVQFVHAPEPLAQQWYRQVRQVFLRTFSV